MLLGTRIQCFFFFCEESLVRDVHSGSCSQMTSSCKCPIEKAFKIISSQVVELLLRFQRPQSQSESGFKV